MKQFYLSSAFCLALFSGAFAQENSKQHSHDDGFNSRQHYQMIAEQHRLVKTYLNFDAFEKMYKEVLKKTNVADKDRIPFAKMLKEKYSLADRYVLISKINSGELTESNIEKYLTDIKPAEYATYYQAAYLKGKESLLDNAPKIHAAGTQEMENWLSSRLQTPVVLSTACGNIDFDAGNFGGWTGNYTSSNCTSPTPNIRNTAGFNFTGMNVTSDQHGLVNGGNDPSVTLATLPCVSPFGGAPITCRLADVNDGCSAADLTYSFTVNNNNTNFTYSYAVVLYDGHPASDAPKVQISMKNLTTGQPINCAAYTIDATQGAGGANGYQQAQAGNTLMYFKPWSQVYIPLLNFLGQNVQVTIVASDCNGGAHRGYCYVDFTCAPLQLLSTTPMICGNQSAVLTAPPGAASYQWAVVGGSGNIVGGTTGQSVTVNQAGHYQVTLGSFGSGCTLVIDTIIPGGPTAPISNFTDNPGCFSVPVPFTDASNTNGGGAITSWSWTFGDGGTSTSQNPNHTYPAAGTYTATLNVTNAGGCVSTYTAAVTVTAGATPTFTASPVCVGAVTSFTNTSAGATSYNWTFGDGNSSTVAQPTNTYTASGSYAVSLTVTAGGGGCGGSTTQTVVVNALPTLTATSNTLCTGGGAVNITAGGASTYTWNTGATTATISQSPGTTTNYTVTGTDANGCVNTTTTSISVISNPTVAVAPTDICAGSTGTLTANGCTAYTWSGPNIIGSTTGTSITANPGATTTYTVIGSIGSCTATTTGVMNVNPMPVPAFVSSVECLGTATIFTNNSTPAGSTYSWSFGDGNTSTTASPTNTYSAAGAYTATLVVTAPGVPTTCVASVTGVVTVKPIPTLNPVSNIIVCDQVQIAVPPFVSVPGGATVAWTNNNTTIGLGGAGAGNIPAFTGTSGGSPTTISGVVTAIPTLNGCPGPAITFTLSVSPQPTVTLTSPPVTCPGQMVPAPTYTTNPNDPNITFGWTNNNTATGMIANGTGIPGSFTAASNNTLSNITGTVTVIPALGTCVGPPATYTVAIYPTPVISPIPNIEFCPNVTSTPINFTIQPGGGTPSFAWFNSNTSIGLAASGTVTPIPPFTGVNAGTTAQVANLSVSGSLNGCPAIPVPFTITVDPNPVAAFTANHLICVGSPMAFTDMSTVGTGFIAGWGWNLDATATPFSTSQNPQLAIQPAGTHSVTLTATTDKGCTNTITQPVYINYLPVASYTGGGQGCPILTVNNFTDASSVTGPAQVVTWNWAFGNGATANSQVIPGVLTYGNPSPVQNAVYTVSLIVSTDSGCVSTTYANPCVTVYPHPLPGFTWGPQDPAPDIESPTVYFFDQSQGATGQNGLQWYLGDVFLNNPANNYTTVQNPVHTYDHYDPYTYYVTQWVQNSYGCKDSITKPIEILPNWTFYIPNAFSPNGDGVNEGFKGTGIGIDNTTYNLWVFDRWGNMIFYSSDLEKAWDGRIQGKNGDIVQEDVYVWKVKFHDFMGKKHEYKGTVSVIK